MQNYKLLLKKCSASVFDFLFIFLNLQILFFIFRPIPRLDFFSTFLIPLLLLPLYSYFLVRFFRQTLGQYFFSIEVLKKGHLEPVTRPFDFIFNSEAKLKKPFSFKSPLPFLMLGAALTLSSSVVWILAANDPTLKKWNVVALPLSENVLKSPDLVTVPFSYLLAALPSKIGKEDLLWELPYLKGPPKSFIGRIDLIWNETDQNKISFSGPLTFSKNTSSNQLLNCFNKFFGCSELRDEIFKKHLKINELFSEISTMEILRIENKELKENEIPYFLYLKGKSKTSIGKTLEVALAINPNLSFQQISFEQRKSLVSESTLFKSLLTVMRFSQELNAPRLFIDDKLSLFNQNSALNEKPTLSEIILAEKLLLSKLSVDPTQLEPFYHLFRFSEMEYQVALKEKNLLSSARTRRLMSALLKYAKDIQPDHAFTKEMEQILASIEKK